MHCCRSARDGHGINQPGKASNVRRIGYRYQRTLAQPAEVRGIGLLTGSAVQLRFQPAAADSGIVFVRTDLRPAVSIPACVAQVTGTQRKTTLGHLPGQVVLVEHVLAALAGLRIDNCTIEIDGVEPPGLDGSARSFVEALRAAGSELQPARRAVCGVDAPVTLSANGSTLSLHPAEADELRISYLLDYGGHGPIGRQAHTLTVTPESFTNELAACRTFLFESEAMELRRQGLGLRTTAADLIVLGNRGPIDNHFRYANEPARHKILDILGDLSLLGHDIRGHVVGYRSGHPLNIELARALAGCTSVPVQRLHRRAA
jgi:UDP-3-O-[3-hydroxymyristoyl] N-acetylglucosamine deacetylase